MNMMNKTSKLLAALLVCVGAVAAQASIIIDTVPVGNPGNPPDTRYVTPPGYGRVGYTYNMGKYEVTAGQYTAFLNAVAATDTYGLYNTRMGSIDDLGANIQRSGSPGSYTYSVAADWANRPVNYVSWGDAARFANWLHNGQPTGAQGLSTTEDGSYFLNGAMSAPALMAVTRKPNATWAIPTEDEWYKAAYHKNDGVTRNYWDYPMGSSAVPDNGNPGGDTGNSANFWDGDYTIGSPYYRTNAGFFGLSGSPYGTFDQGGNVWEWNNEANISGSYRVLRGGSFYNIDNLLHASYRIYGIDPTIEDLFIGFRVSEVPEPASIAFLALGGVGMLIRRRSVRG